MSENNPYGENMSPDQKREAWATAMSLVVEAVKVTHYERGTSPSLLASIEMSSVADSLHHIPNIDHAWATSTSLRALATLFVAAANEAGVDPVAMAQNQEHAAMRDWNI